jgi:signal transduction histidine kinase/CheY-like chemotaxis protein
MYFFDNIGFFSLICLLIQCGMAWIFAGFFGVLARGRGPWMYSWRSAFLGLGMALAALGIRFALAHHSIARHWVMSEGDLHVRLLYGLYFTGKLLFGMCLLSGAASMRGEVPFRKWWSPPVWVLLAFAFGVVSPTIEMLLLAQGIWLPVMFWRAASLLRPRAGDEPEAARWVAVRVLQVWAVMWLLYGIAVLICGPLHPGKVWPWSFLLRVNSLIDLTLQVVAASSLIVVVMSDTQRTALSALRERDRLRERVQRDDKLRALSTLVSGVAHEINNPLTAILGFADDLDDADPGVRSRAAAIVREQSERCRGIVQRMSLLGRRAGLEPTEIQVGESVRRVARGFEPQIAKARLQLQLDLPPALRPLLADATGFEQVLANLIGNALHASPPGGVVTVGARALPAGLEVTVSDQGRGVPVAARTQIFEPFWTTKKDGQGTGLGLAVVEAIVATHGGHVDVGDAPGGGARFAVLWPWQPGLAATSATELPAAAESMPTLAAYGPPAGRRLLVIDDEPLVRSMIAQRARTDGWSVEEVASGEEGLRCLLEQGDRFDAVVCDVRMPGMSGAGFHDALARQAPQWLQRLVFVTGDLASREAASFAARCRAPIVPKPFEVGELLGRLREVARPA